MNRLDIPVVITEGPYFLWPCNGNMWCITDGRGMALKPIGKGHPYAIKVWKRKSDAEEVMRAISVRPRT